MGLHTRRLEQILKPFFLYKQVTLVTSSQLSRGFLTFLEGKYNMEYID